jgi:hypothetical protein
MEESIYKRQINKESTSLRIIDETPNKRHIDIEEVEALYKSYEKATETKIVEPNEVRKEINP